MNKNLIQEYYYLTLVDIREGASIEELEETIKFYESLEEYEVCAGIKKAIDETKYKTIRDI